MRAAAHDVRGAHQHLQAGIVRGLGGLDRRRKLGDMHAIADRFLDMLDRRVIVARQRDPRELAAAHDVGPVLHGVAGVDFLAADDGGVELRVRRVLLAAVILLPLRDVCELALAGRMVHHRDQLQVLVGQEWLHFLDHVAAAEFAAQMQEVLGTGDTRFLRRGDGRSELLHARAELLVVVVVADTQGVEHGGDAGADHLRVMRENRARRWPFDLRARHEMHLEMIGVQLDKAGDQVVAAEVDAFFRPTPLADFHDPPVGDRDVAREGLVGRYHAGIRQNETVAHG